MRLLQNFNIGRISRTSSWPEFRASAAENGIRSSLSVPLTTGGVAIGTLNLYSEDVDGFHGCERKAATLAGAVAAAVALPPAA